MDPNSATIASPTSLLKQTVVEPLERYEGNVLVVLVLNAHHLMLSSLPQFYDGVVTYQNEITLGNGLPVYQPSKKGVPTSRPDPEYR